MPRQSHPLVVAAIVALHTLLSVGGPGLHALPGMGHGSELNRPAGDDHRHGPGKTAHDLTKECPVCHYLGGEQGRPDAGPAPVSWLSTAAPPITSDPPALSAPGRPSSARAPPALS
jgi:hypothetical protein